MPSTRRNPDALDLSQGLVSLETQPKLSPTSQARATLINLDSSICDHQAGSPLYQTLSTEVRQIIFRYVFEAEFSSPAAIDDVVAYLQGTRGRRLNSNLLSGETSKDWGRIYCTVDTALLQTCRMVYLEARYMPVENDIHFLYEYHPRGHLSKYFMQDGDCPFYGEGKVLMGVINDYNYISATSSVHHWNMTSRQLSAIRKVTVYDTDWKAYLTGHNFFNLRGLRPQCVDLVCRLGQSSWRPDSNPLDVWNGWHENLEELTLRIDAPPISATRLGNMRHNALKWFLKEYVGGVFRVEDMGPLEENIKKKGGGMLKMVAEKSRVFGTWTGLNRKGDGVEWHSVTYVWKAVHVSRWAAQAV